MPIAKMKGAFCICYQIKRKLKVKRDKNKLLRIIKNANRDPQYDIKRQGIISEVNKGTKLDILEIGDFTLVEVIGTGASSDVCLVVRKEDRQKFAVKFLKHEISTKDYINEATLLMSCSNACATIVNLVGIITTPRCLVFEYHKNGSLDQAFKEDDFNVTGGEETEFPFLRRLGYILDMCKAVHQLHRENICHRDIAMRNLLLSDDKKHVLLADFSLSRIISTALVTQSTLTTIVPTKSAPETVRGSNISKCGREKWERSYSLKSDIWSLGVSMFEIINMEELGDIHWGKNMPGGFSKKRLPSKIVFNRIQDLWILILRCWDKRPQDRPQIWNIQERLETLLADPWNVGSENDGYTRAPNKYFTRGGGILNKQSFQSYCSYSGMSADCSSMGAVFEDQQRQDSGNLYFDSLMSWHMTEEESTKSNMSSMMTDFPLKFNSFGTRGDIKIKVSSNTQLHKSQKRFRGDRINNENNSNMHLSLPHGTPGCKRSTWGGLLNREPLQRLNFHSRRNISDGSISNTHLTVGTGLKFFKRLGSISSFPSTNASSEFEESIHNDRVEYCTPLSLSFNSSPTNIKHCKDRHFFSNKDKDFNFVEKPYISDYLYVPDTPKSEAVDEQSAASDPSDTPRLEITV